MKTVRPTAATGTVLVTGCSSGIGLETALYLAERGWRVYAGLRDLSRRGDLDAEVTRRGVAVTVIALDVGNQASVRDALDRIEGEGAAITALVSNAGINVRGFFEELNEAEMRSVFDVNLLGSMRAIRAVLPGMRRLGAGRVVLMSSSGGRFGAPASSAYCASKFALEGFGESLSLELAAFGISVSLIEPGFITTELFGRNRTAAEGVGRTHSLYRRRYQLIESWTDRQVASATLRPRDVAVVVEQALTAPRPRLRYVVGRRTRLLVTLRRHLPEWWFDRVWARLVRMATLPKDAIVRGRQWRDS